MQETNNNYNTDHNNNTLVADTVRSLSTYPDKLFSSPDQLQELTNYEFSYLIKTMLAPLDGKLTRNDTNKLTKYINQGNRALVYSVVSDLVAQYSEYLSDIGNPLSNIDDYNLSELFDNHGYSVVSEESNLVKQDELSYVNTYS